MLADERWRPVVGCPSYEVSDEGRVRRIAPGRGARPGTFLRPRATRKGYVRVALHDGTRRFDAAIHRLVLRAFVGEPPTSEHQANHLDGDKANNRLSNLEWASPSENQLHALHTGLRRPLKGEDAGRSKLTQAEVTAIRSSPRYVTNRDLAGVYGVSNQLISAIRLGRVWKHLLPDDCGAAMSSGRKGG